MSFDIQALEAKAKELQEKQKMEDDSPRENTGLTLNKGNPSGEIDSVDAFHTNFIDAYIPESLQAKFRTDVNRDKFRLAIDKYAKRSKYRLGKKCSVEDCAEYDMNECPFMKLGEDFVPHGERCPVELMEIDGFSTLYEDMLINSCGVDPIMVQLHLKDLVIIEITLNRVNTQIATRGILENSPIFAMPKSETIVNAKIMSPLIDAQERLTKRKERILKSMLVTPEAKARYKMKSDKDLASLMGELKRRAHESIIRYDEENKVIETESKKYKDFKPDNGDK